MYFFFLVLFNESSGNVNKVTLCLIICEKTAAPNIIFFLEMFLFVCKYERIYDKISESNTDISFIISCQILRIFYIRNT